MAAAAPLPPLTNFFVRSRSRDTLELGLPTAEHRRFGGAYKIVIPLAPDAHPIEVGQTLALRPGRVETETWSNGREAKVYVAPGADVVPFVPRISPKVAGIDSATCKRLADRLGADFAAQVAADPDALAAFRYSAAKRKIIVNACKVEAKAVRKVKPPEVRIIEALRQAGASAARARQLAARFDAGLIAANPYAPLFDGSLSFKKADRFARIIAPKSAAQLRPQAIVVHALRALAAEGDTIAAENAIVDRAWLDFGLGKASVAAAIEGLTRRDFVKLAARGKPRAISIFGDREPDVYGLASLIEAERRIEAEARRTDEQPSPHETREAVEAVILNAGALLRRPGFELDADQADALRAIFDNRVSIITGPPGSGKTAIVALANLIACWRFRNMATPITGVALAGRAASVLADNATVARDEGRLLKFPAATIHRAFGLEADADADELEKPEAAKDVQCGVLVLDEASMVNAALLATIFERSEAQHVVLVGDCDQLDPIGPGAPFADLIARGLAPVTRLRGNYRSEGAALRTLIEVIREGEMDRLAPFVDGASVDYLPAAFGMRGHAVGSLWADLIDGGASPHDIAVITPRNVGDDGAERLNRDIRLALGFGASPQVGDLLIVTKNDYGAIAAPDHPRIKSGDRLDPADDEAGEDEANDDERGGRVAIFNGERGEVVRVEGDVIDVLFPATLTAPERRVRFLANGDRPPEGTAFGYAMTAHKAQGSQFKFVILITARPDRFVSWASVYTAASRTREQLFIVGDEREFIESVGKDCPRRQTLLGRA